MSKEENQRDRAVLRQVHHLFWRANWQSKWTLIACYLTRIPATVAYTSLIPLVSAWAVQAILARQFNRVPIYALGVVLLSLVYVVLWAGGGVVISKNAITGSRYIQGKVFHNFLHKDYDFYSNTFFGSIGAQATRLRDAYNGYGEIVTLAIPKQLTIVLGGITIIAYHSLFLAGLTLLAMVFVLSFTLWSSSWRLQFRRRLSQASSVIAGEVGDALSHGATVKSFALEDFEARRLDQSMNAWSKAQFRSWLSALPADAGRMVLAAMTTAALLLVSAHLYQHGNISITMVVLVQLYVIRLVTSTLDIAELVKRVEEVMGAAYEPVRTMLLPATVLDPPHAKKLPKGRVARIELAQVDFHYADAALRSFAVRDFSLQIHPGEKVGVVGYSGSGKTTLTKLLLRFMDVSAGAITLDGIDIRNLAQKDLRRMISYVPQEPLLFHRSIAENIGYARGNTASRTQILRAAKLAYVDEFVRDLPRGYDTLVGERGVKLSGGQRQRVAIARALLKDAPILVLDEATSALDSHSEKYIQKALGKLMQGRTALVIAHRLSTIQHMDRIVVMHKGKIVQTGTHAELLEAQNGIYAQLWAHQSGGYIGADTTP